MEVQVIADELQQYKKCEGWIQAECSCNGWLQSNEKGQVRREISGRRFFTLHHKHTLIYLLHSQLTCALAGAVRFSHIAS
jgi:hypothetical protein